MFNNINFNQYFLSKIYNRWINSQKKFENPVNSQCPSCIAFEALIALGLNQWHSFPNVVEEMVRMMKDVQRGAETYWEFYSEKKHKIPSNSASTRLIRLLHDLQVRYGNKLEMMNSCVEYDHRENGTWLRLKTSSEDIRVSKQAELPSTNPHLKKHWSLNGIAKVLTTICIFVKNLIH
jgi:hypothetical protein